MLGSPLEAIARYERARGIPANFVNRVVVATAPAGAWSRLERGELTLERFYPAFERDCADAGHAIDARELMAQMGASAAPRPRMLAAIRQIRAQGFKTGALTNNWPREAGSESDAGFREHFDAFVESSAVGMRKPDPRIYEHACAELGVPPAQAVFLDDIGRNLKPARQLGMATIKVHDPDRALAELAALLGVELAPRGEGSAG
ncbi:MAG: HAD family phosphatase [Deltaproteobacteria bacterium]|nr:MAG: HAD family phosphatase [Deltaproteobacteria bacterium]